MLSPELRGVLYELNCRQEIEGRLKLLALEMLDALWRRAASGCWRAFACRELVGWHASPFLMAYDSAADACKSVPKTSVWDSSRRLFSLGSTAVVLRRSRSERRLPWRGVKKGAYWELAKEIWPKGEATTEMSFFEGGASGPHIRGVGWPRWWQVPFALRDLFQ